MKVGRQNKAFLNWAFGVIIAITSVLIVTYLLGHVYQSTRLLIVGQPATAYVSKCTCSDTLVVVDDVKLKVAYFQLELSSIEGSSFKERSEFSSISYQSPLRERREDEPSASEICGTSVFNESFTIAKNWCEFEHQNVDVIGNPNSDTFVLDTGSKFVSVLQYLDPFALMSALFLGIIFFVPAMVAMTTVGFRKAVSTAHSIISNNYEVLRSKEHSVLKKINETALPASILLLSATFIIGFGLLLLRSIEIFDVKNTVLSGSILLIGAVIITQSPWMILRGFQIAKSSENDWVLLVRNVITILILVHLIIESVSYALAFAPSDSDSLGQYIWNFVVAGVT